MEHTPLTGSTTIDHVLTIIGALVPLFSALASFFNHKVRVSTSDEALDDPSAKFLKAAAVLNVLAVNLDKASQLVKLARGQNAPQTAQQDAQADGQGSN